MVLSDDWKLESDLFLITSKNYNDINIRFSEYLIRIYTSDGSNIVESYLTNMNSLYFDEVVVCSVNSLMGYLLGVEVSKNNICSHILNAESLEKKCREVFSFESLVVFLQVSKCMVENLNYCIFKISSGNLVKCCNEDNSVELPVETLWTLLILSEYFGFKILVESCKFKLMDFFFKKLSIDSNNIYDSWSKTRLFEGFSIDEIKHVFTSFQSYLNNFELELSSSSASKINKTDNSFLSKSDTIEKKHKVLLSKSSAENFSPIKKDENLFINSTNSPFNLSPSLVTKEKESPPIFEQHKSKTYSSENHPISTDHIDSFYFETETDGSQSYIADSFHSSSLHSDQNHSSIHDSLTKSRLHIQDLEDSQEGYTDHEIPYFKDENFEYFYENSQKDFETSTSLLQTNHNNFDIENSAEQIRIQGNFAPKEENQSYNFYEKVESKKLNHSNPISPTKFVQNENSTQINKSHKKLKISPPSQPKENISRSNQKPLSSEDLKLSREIALLRLKEVKVKEELERSRLLTERALKENRLKSLELKSAVIRMSSQSPQKSRDLVSKSFSSTNNQKNIPRQLLSQPVGESAVKSYDSSADKEKKYKEARIRAISRIRQQRANLSKPKVSSRSKSENRDQNPKIRSKELGRGGLYSKIQNIQSRPDHSTQDMIIHDEFQFENLLLTDKIYSHKALEAVGRGISPTRIVYEEPDAKAPAKTNLQTKKYPKTASISSPSSVVQKANDISDEIDEVVKPKLEYSKEFLQKEKSIILDKQQNRTQNESQFSQTMSKKNPSLSFSANSEPQIITIRVLRAWDLPECLGGTNSYVVFDWGRQGKSSTQAVRNTTSPTFGAVLKFKSPFKEITKDEFSFIKNDPLMSGNILEVNEDKKLISYAGPIKAYLYNRNLSLSDDMIGMSEFDINQHISSHSEDPIVLYLSDSLRNAAGCLEILVNLTQ